MSLATNPIFTQHLITTIPHPEQRQSICEALFSPCLMNNTASLSLVIEDILDGHTREKVDSASFNLLTIQ